MIIIVGKIIVAALRNDNIKYSDCGLYMLCFVCILLNAAVLIFILLRLRNADE